MQGPQSRHDVVVPPARERQRTGEQRGVVRSAAVLHDARGDAVASQRRAVRVTVAAQRIVLGGEDDRARQPAVRRWRWWFR